VMGPGASDTPSDKEEAAATSSLYTRLRAAVFVMVGKAREGIEMEGIEMEGSEMVGRDWDAARPATAARTAANFIIVS